MSCIYIVLVDTPGLFASIIRFFLKQKYIHVAISMDKNLDETYSINRRNPRIPFFAGLVKEDKSKILKKYPNAEYLVCKISCNIEQKKYIRHMLHCDFKKRFHYHYTVLGLPLILLGKPFKQKYYHTCSSYLARILEDSGICLWKKHTSIVTPKDFFCDLEKEVIFEGPLRDLIDQKDIAFHIKLDSSVKRYNTFLHKIFIGENKGNT